MMSEAPVMIARLMRTGRVDRDDVHALRLVFAGEDPAAETLLDALFAVEAAIGDKAHEWRPFFVETVADFVESVAGARWLSARRALLSPETASELDRRMARGVARG